LSELTVVGVLASCAAYGITIALSRSASRFNGIDGKFLNRSVIAFIILLCIFLTGPFGVIILFISTVLGLVPWLINIPRVYCMGVIMIPVMLFSFGIAGV
jgi:putative membrane protein